MCPKCFFPFNVKNLNIVVYVVYVYTHIWMHVDRYVQEINIYKTNNGQQHTGQTWQKTKSTAS